MKEFELKLCIQSFDCNTGLNKSPVIWIELPISSGDFHSIIKRLNYGEPCKNWRIVDSCCSIQEVCEYIEQSSCINELNYFASLMKELSNEELITYEYAVQISGFNYGIADFINLSANLDRFSLLWIGYN